MQLIYSLSIKKFYSSPSTQKLIFVDLEDAYFDYSIKGVRIIKHNHDKMFYPGLMAKKKLSAVV